MLGECNKNMSPDTLTLTMPCIIAMHAIYETNWCLGQQHDNNNIGLDLETAYGTAEIISYWDNIYREPGQYNNILTTTHSYISWTTFFTGQLACRTHYVTPAITIKS